MGWFVLIPLMFVGFLILLTGIFTVKQQTSAIVERFGRAAVALIHDHKAKVLVKTAVLVLTITRVKGLIHGQDDIGILEVRGGVARAREAYFRVWQKFFYLLLPLFKEITLV